MATTWQIGDRIQNRWEIHKILRGGMGIVYIVYDHELREPFAAKSFQEEIFARHPAIADRFTQEALAWVNLDVHQNVTRARSVQIIEGKPLLFLEYVSGGDLSKRIGTPRLTEDLPQVLHFAIQLCDGMTYALSKGIKAHRDLKPENCLITQDGTLKITDFGLARVVAMRGGEGGRGGTPEYMPPEQWENFEQADERSDIYSLGGMLYAMLIGHPPFGQRPLVQVLELERRHKRELPARLPYLAARQFSNSFTQQLNAIISTSLAKDTEHRYQNFRQVRDHLADIYESVTSEAAPQPVVGAELDAEQWYNKGASLGHLGYYHEEIACCDRAIKLKPQWASPWSTKGAGLLNLGLSKESLDCCNRALELNPHYAKAWLNKGAALGIQGQDEDALNCFERALYLNPLYDKAWWHKGVSLCGLGRHEESLAFIDHAITLNPYDAVAWINRSVTLNRLGRLEDAIASLDQALALDPPNTQALLKKASFLVDVNQYKEAIACYDRALEANPGLASAWAFKGLALYSGFQEYRAALICFEEAERRGYSDAAAAVAALRRVLGQQ